MNRPEPVDEQIKLNPKKYILSETDPRGVITYANDYFVEICGYDKLELIGKPHNIIRHPDMPKVIFKLMWERLKKREGIFAAVKNLAKDGKYYWVVTEFTIKVDVMTDRIIGYKAYRKAATDKVIEEIEPLYKTLLEIEKTHSVEASQRYLEAFLEEKGMTYDEYIDNLMKRSGGFGLFFAMMKKFFG